MIQDHFDKQEEARKKASGKQTLTKDRPKGPNIKRSDFTSVKPKS